MNGAAVRSPSYFASRLCCASTLFWITTGSSYDGHLHPYGSVRSSTTHHFRSLAFLTTQCESPPRARSGALVSPSSSSKPIRDQKAVATERINTSNSDHDSVRKRSTPADLFFQAHHKLPRPSVMHMRLDEDAMDDRGNGILVIGDVHGCFEECMRLHDKAVVQENGGTPFRCVILVGDLCNKGPESARVVRFVRQQPHWYAVRGNHDDGAVAAALGDTRRRAKSTYQWVVDEKGPALSDDDVAWMSELPYTITVPKELLTVHTTPDLSTEADIVIVHAGIVPGVPLSEQKIETMVTIREVTFSEETQAYAYHAKKSGQERCSETVPRPWATVWQGPQRIICGHDARRGLQRHPGDWAIGLDTGACYGKALTGIVLPRRSIVQVEALRTHCPIVDSTTQ